MGACDRSKEAVMGLHDACLSSHPLGGSRLPFPSWGHITALAPSCPGTLVTQETRREKGGEEPCGGGRQCEGGGQGPAWSPAPRGAEKSLCQAHRPEGVDGQDQYFPGREGGLPPARCYSPGTCVNTHTGHPDLTLGESADTRARQGDQSMPPPASAHMCAPLKCSWPKAKRLWR